MIQLKPITNQIFISVSALPNLNQSSSLSPHDMTWHDATREIRFDITSPYIFFFPSRTSSFCSVSSLTPSVREVYIKHSNIHTLPNSLIWITTKLFHFFTEKHAFHLYHSFFHFSFFFYIILALRSGTLLPSFIFNLTPILLTTTFLLHSSHTYATPISIHPNFHSLNTTHSFSTLPLSFSLNSTPAQFQLFSYHSFNYPYPEQHSHFPPQNLNPFKSTTFQTLIHPTN